MSRDVNGHDADVDDSDVGSAIDTESGVDYTTHIEWEHGAAADGVVFGSDGVGDVGGEGVVGRGGALEEGKSTSDGQKTEYMRDKSNDDSQWTSSI